MGERALTLSDDTPLRLKDACEIVFNGSVSVATLKAEHARGNLEISKIGKAYYTTRAKLREMEEKCLVVPQVQGSGSTRRAKPGPSLTDASAAAQASVHQKLEERKKRLGITSRQSTR